MNIGASLYQPWSGAASVQGLRRYPVDVEVGGWDTKAQANFEQCVDEALESLPDELRSSMSNVAVMVEDEPSPGTPLLGLYQGVPLTRRSGNYGGGLAVSPGVLVSEKALGAQRLLFDPRAVVAARRLSRALRDRSAAA